MNYKLIQLRYYRPRPAAGLNYNEGRYCAYHTDNTNGADYRITLQVVGLSSASSGTSKPVFELLGYSFIPTVR